MSDQPQTEHILTTFGREYPVDSSSVGFPGEYYNATYGLLQSWYSEKQVGIDQENNGIGGKPWTRSGAFTDNKLITWNSEFLAVIGLTEFLQNLGQHMLKLLKAIGAKQTDQALRALDVQINGLKGVVFLKIDVPPPYKGQQTEAHKSTLLEHLDKFQTLAQAACVEYKILSCQISDAILVNALAAIVTMQRVHIRWNEELYIESSTNCPIAVPWVGDFGPHGVGRWDKIGSNPNILEVPPGSRNQESAESAEIRTKPPKAPKALKPLSKPQLVAPANPQLSELVTEDVTVDDIPVGFPVGPAPIPGGVLPGGYTEQFPEENGYNAPRAKVQRLI